MNINIDNVGFESKFKLIGSNEFYQKIKVLDPKLCEVGRPWTVETMKVGERLYTTDVEDCLVCGFTNGITSDMCHLATRNKEQAKEESNKGFGIVKEFNIDNIEQNIAKRVNLFDKNLHGFILGGWYVNKRYLEQIKHLYEKYKIPFSIMADRRLSLVYGKFSILHDTPEDTVFLSNSLDRTTFYSAKVCNPNICKDKNGRYLNELEFNDNHVTYNVYEKVNPDSDKQYIGIRKTTNQQEFLNDQFNEVSLCKLDRWM